jgi:hypothetical protein
MIMFFVLVFLTSQCALKANLVKDSRRTRFGLIEYYGTIDMMKLNLREAGWTTLALIFGLLCLADLVAFFGTVLSALS